MKWGADHVYSVGAKMFCVSYDDGKGKANVSFKVDDDLFLQYTDRAGFIPRRTWHATNGCRSPI